VNEIDKEGSANAQPHRSLRLQEEEEEAY